METFWSNFIQSNTFNEFLRSEDRSDDNNLKHFMHILYLISKKQYKIHDIRELLEFEVEKVISPRKFIKILISINFFAVVGVLGLCQKTSAPLNPAQPLQQFLLFRAGYRHELIVVHFEFAAFAFDVLPHFFQVD